MDLQQGSTTHRDRKSVMDFVLHNIKSFCAHVLYMYGHSYLYIIRLVEADLIKRYTLNMMPYIHLMVTSKKKFHVVQNTMFDQ